MGETTSRAFAIGTFTTSRQPEYFTMGLACALSLREAGYTEPILFVTVEMSADEERQLLEQGFQVVRKPGFDYPALDCGPYRRLSFNDAQKIHYWSLPFEKIIALDPDVLCLRECPMIWSWGELSCQAGLYSPLNSSILVLSPREQTFQELERILHGPFDPESGWRDAGKFPHWRNEGPSDWRFLCANAAQGLLFYYFTWVQASLHFRSFQQCFQHFGGKAKQDPQYRQRVRELVARHGPPDAEM